MAASPVNGLNVYPEGEPHPPHPISRPADLYARCVNQNRLQILNTYKH